MVAKMSAIKLKDRHVPGKGREHIHVTILINLNHTTMDMNLDPMKVLGFNSIPYFRHTIMLFSYTIK